MTDENIEALHWNGWIYGQKGIPKQVFSAGPFEPPSFRKENLRWLPAGTQIRFFNYD